MRAKAWLAARVSLRLARLPSLQAALASPTLHACGCARPYRTFFGHKTVKADHIYNDAMSYSDLCVRVQIPTRSLLQIRTHAQKYFLKLHRSQTLAWATEYLNCRESRVGFVVLALFQQGWRMYGFWLL